MTKLEKELQEHLDKERARPIGHTISNVTIDMGNSADYKKAIADAVKAGMVALQNIESGNSYGIYLAGTSDQASDEDSYYEDQY